MQWSEYQQAIFDRVENTQENLIVEAVAGCLAGNTVIGVNRGGKSYNCTITHLTHMMNGGSASGKVFNPEIPTKVRSYNPSTGAIELRTVARAIASGPKPTCLLRAGEIAIRATTDHKFLTPHGWAPLSDLFVGDSILLDGGKGRLGEALPSKPQYKYLPRMDHHPFASITHNRGVAYYRVPLHRLVMEATLNNEEFDEFVANIEAGRTRDYTFLDPEKTIVHHDDEDSLNNRIENLVMMTPEEHQSHHAKNGGWLHVQSFATSRVITQLCTWNTEETFDLTMADEEQPNFLANGIVVHNSGKTTTLVEIIRRLRSGRILMAAFNNRIVAELSKRVSPQVAQCRTLHSVGNSAWKARQWESGSGCKLNKNKTMAMMDKVMSWPQRQKYGQMGRLITLAKGAGLVPNSPQLEGGFYGLKPDQPSTWLNIVEMYDLDQFLDERTGKLDEVGIKFAQLVLLEGIMQSETVIDFDDQLYMPVIASAPFEQFDVVLLDEAQDVSPLQVEIVKRTLKHDGRVIAVGDPHQAIYGFRGAMSSSLAYIGAAFGCKSMPLSVCYRCGTKIVKQAQQYVGHILPFEGSPEGLVEHTAVWDVSKFEPMDVILCRLNAPLINLAFSLIRQKVPCQILGKDIASGLTGLVKKMKADSVNNLLEKLKQYHAREVIKSEGDPDKIARVQDKIATLHVFIDELSPSDGVDKLITNILAMFQDEQRVITGMLTLSTVHKAKGMEWDRVFILDAEDLMPLPWAKDGWQYDQELNLCYVAATRAKRELRYVSSLGMGLKVHEEPDFVKLDEAKGEAIRD